MGRKSQYEEIFNSTRLEAIKNHEEMKNMLKEVGESVIMPRLPLLETENMEKMKSIKNLKNPHKCFVVFN